MIKPLLIALSAVLVVPNLVDKDIQSRQVLYNGKEKYAPQLSFLNSVVKLEKFVDALASDKKIAIGSPAYLELLENTVAHRFYEGLSHKSLSQDWITALTDRISGTGYSTLIKAGEILQHPGASPIQQTIVVMEVLKRKQISYRRAGFSDLLAVEVSINGQWYILDAYIETAFRKEKSLHQHSGRQTAGLKKYHKPGIHPNSSDAIKVAELTPVKNSTKSPYSNLENLQEATGFLSKTLWLFPLGIALLYKKHPFKMYALKSPGKYVRMQTLRPVYNT